MNDDLGTRRDNEPQGHRDLIDDRLSNMPLRSRELVAAALVSAEVGSVIQAAAISTDTIGEALDKLNEVSGRRRPSVIERLFETVGRPWEGPSPGAIALGRAAERAAHHFEEMKLSAEDPESRQRASDLKDLLDAIGRFFRAISQPKPKPKE